MIYLGYVTNGKSTIAVRVATSSILKKIIKELGCPVFMTSANKSGEDICKSLDEIEKNCNDIDGMMEGDIIYSISSTIVDCREKKIKILREGPISIDDLKRVM